MINQRVTDNEEARLEELLGVVIGESTGNPLATEVVCTSVGGELEHGALCVLSRGHNLSTKKPVKIIIIITNEKRLLHPQTRLKQNALTVFNAYKKARVVKSFVEKSSWSNSSKEKRWRATTYENILGVLGLGGGDDTGSDGCLFPGLLDVYVVDTVLVALVDIVSHLVVHVLGANVDLK